MIPKEITYNDKIQSDGLVPESHGRNCRQRTLPNSGKLKRNYGMTRSESRRIISTSTLSGASISIAVYGSSRFAPLRQGRTAAARTSAVWNPATRYVDR
jgi:hypothetical protein